MYRKSSVNAVLYANFLDRRIIHVDVFSIIKLHYDHCITNFSISQTLGRESNGHMLQHLHTPTKKEVQMNRLH